MPVQGPPIKLTPFSVLGTLSRIGLNVLGICNETAEQLFTFETTESCYHPNPDKQALCWQRMLAAKTRGLLFKDN